mgnify:CR=1 FL=1
MMQWFDAGLNLSSEQFSDEHDHILARAHQSSVNACLLIGTDVGSTQNNLQYCRKSSRLWTTAGVHPHYAAAVNANWQHDLMQLATQPHVVAIGECGLDFDRMLSSETKQIEVFATQLQLAKQLQKPVYLHERAAFDQQVGILQEHQVSHGIAHCFTGDRSQLATYLEMGLYIGITGWLCDERRGMALQDALQFLPLDRIILETDAPYLIPRNIQPKPKSRRNEPALLPFIGQRVAELKGVSIESVATHCWQNTLRLFGVEAICPAA